MEEQMIMEAEAKEMDDSEEVDLNQIKKKSKYNVEDMTLDLDQKMKIVKKSRKEKDITTKMITKGSKITALREKRKHVKSRS
jgi:RIO-like serine/threonine protein kinase